MGKSFFQHLPCGADGGEGWQVIKVEEIHPQGFMVGLRLPTNQVALEDQLVGVVELQRVDMVGIQYSDYLVYRAS